MMLQTLKAGAFFKLHKWYPEDGSQTRVTIYRPRQRPCSSSNLTASNQWPLTMASYHNSDISFGNLWQRHHRFYGGLVDGADTTSLLLKLLVEKATKSLLPTMLGTTSSDELMAKDGITRPRTQWYQEHSNHLYQNLMGLLSRSMGVWKRLWYPTCTLFTITPFKSCVASQMPNAEYCSWLWVCW